MLAAYEDEARGAFVRQRRLHDDGCAKGRAKRVGGQRRRIGPAKRADDACAQRRDGDRGETDRNGRGRRVGVGAACDGDDG
eukprot:3592001-Prymnesium_polylepis.1